MLSRLKNVSILVFCFFLAQNVFAFQNDNINQLRKSFKETVSQDFEIVKDYINNRSAERGGETFWLVHVKPKRSGHYALKYTYKYTHKFSHPEEGENELIIRVGEKNCNRYNSNNLGIGNVCLGDTIIVPIRLDQRANHEFSLKSTYSDGQHIGKTEKFWTPAYTETLPIVNHLEKHLKYLGTVRSVMPHRNYGAETITYTAYFEAKEPGRFNFATTTFADNEKISEAKEWNALDALPIIILKPGTPITALVYSENTINYSDEKRFSGHAGNNFLTKLLILQPGDVFSVEYSSYVEREELGKKNIFTEKDIDRKNRKLVMYKLPFVVNKDWSYNEWLIDYLPK